MKLVMILFCCLCFFSCESQVQAPINSTKDTKAIVGGPFDNRNLFFDGMPANMDDVDTTKAWLGSTNRLVISGTIYKRDGKTPAPNVVLYFYHTDDQGLYSGGGIHGELRGWVKSNENGEYKILTARPAAYPNNRGEPAHIHPAVLEPEIEMPYYLDAFIFDDDKSVTSSYRASMENRGGSGVLRPAKSGGVLIAEHDIILGLNIPNYPSK